MSLQFEELRENSTRETFFADELETFGDQVALITEDGVNITFSQLAQQADLFAARLGRDRTLLLIEMANEVAPIVAYLGSLRARHPVILVSESSESIARTYQPDWIYRRTEKSWHLQKGIQDRSKNPHPELSLLLSTSGSTGSAKLVRLSRKNIDANAKAICEYLGLSVDERPITALPLHYCYGLSVLNSHLACGATILLTARGVRDAEFWDFFEDQKGTSLAGVPHTFDLLERTNVLERRLSGLRYLTVAGGRMMPAKVQTYARWADGRGARFFVMYGQTEATARMAYLPPELVEPYPDCIGHAVPGGRFRLVDPVKGEITEHGQPGRLVYSGPNVMMGYAQSSDDLARGPELAELNTNDIAERNEAGLYRIVGRSGRFSKLFGIRLDFDEIESFLEQRGYIAAVTGDDNRLAVAVSGHSPCTVRNTIVERYKLARHVVGVVSVPEIPRLSSDKVDYPVIQKLVDSSTSPAAPTTLSGAVGIGKSPEMLASEFADTFRRAEVALEESFLSLGGDSLTYVQISLIIEEYLGFVPDDWEHLTILELQAMMGGADRQLSSLGAKLLDTDILLRAFAICGVVVVHAGDAFSLYGGSELLFLLAGYNLARFQSKALFEGRLLKALQPYFVNILLPLIALIVVHDVAKGGFDIKRYLLIGNFYNLSIQYFYFLEVLVQCTVILALVVSLPPVRSYAKEKPWHSGVAFFVIAVAVHFTSLRIQDLAALDYRVPQFFLYLLVYGWCLYFAKSVTQKALALVAGLTIFPLSTVLPSQTLWLVIGSFFVLFVPKLAIAGVARRIASAVSGACFYIYMLHGLPVALLQSHLASYPNLRIYLLLLLSIVFGKLVGDGLSVLARAMHFSNAHRRGPESDSFRAV